MPTNYCLLRSPARRITQAYMTAGINLFASKLQYSTGHTTLTTLALDGRNATSYY